MKHLDRYLDEFKFRFNNRNNAYLFRDTLLRLLRTSNLEYKELTGSLNLSKYYQIIWFAFTCELVVESLLSHILIPFNH